MYFRVDRKKKLPITSILFALGFSKEKIIRKRDSKIKKTELLEEFKNWYIANYGRNNLPNGKEIIEYCDKMFGKSSKGKWMNVQILYDDQDDSEDDISLD